MLFIINYDKSKKFWKTSFKHAQPIFESKWQKVLAGTWQKNLVWEIGKHHPN
jgi:hypothetical protein